MASYRQWSRCVAAACCVVAGMAACGNRVDDEALWAQAEYLILEQRYDEAIPLLRQFLVRNPGHSGGHYYLGRCYFASPEGFWFTLAEGELQTALQLFREDGRISRIERFDDDYFELICHLDLAKVFVQQAVFLIETRGMPVVIRRLLRQGQNAIDAAREVDPTSPDVELLQEGIDDIREAFGAMDRSAPPGMQI